MANLCGVANGAVRDGISACRIGDMAACRLAARRRQNAMESAKAIKACSLWHQAAAAFVT